MPKGRMLNKKISYDEKVANLSLKATVFFVFCIPHLDIEGKIFGNSVILKGLVVPHIKELTPKTIEKCQKELVDVGLILLYGNNQKYMKFLGFDKNQTLRTDRETPSDIPDPIPAELQQNSSETPAQVKYKLNISKDKLSKDKLIQDIISDLNLVLGTSYKTTSLKTKELIETRLKEGFTLEDFKAVHRNMAKRWGADNKMRAFLRPITLYSGKFESYLNIHQELPISTAGAKTLMAGKEWLNKKEIIDVGKK